MQVFKEENWINISISLSWHLLCNISQNIEKSIFVPIDIGSSKQIIETLINCSTGGMFMDQNFAKKFKIKNLKKLIKAFSVDGTENKKGTIKSYMDLEFWIGDKKVQGTILCNRTRETKDHPRISLVEQIQPDYQLEERGDQMATLKIDWKGLLEKESEWNNNQRLKK